MSGTVIYWGGVPSISELKIRPINDPEARLNAVRAGQIDYAIGITPTGAATAADDPNVQIIRGGAASSNALI